MQEIKPNQEPKFTTDLEHPSQPVMQDKGSNYLHQIKEERLKVSIRPPLRAHQHLIQRQQYYTGDA
jgi:hypothetical protein